MLVVRVDLLFYPVALLAILAPTGFFLRRHDPIEAMALGAALGVAGIGAIALGRFFLLLPPGPAPAIGLVSLASAAAILIAALGITARLSETPRRLPPNTSLLAAAAAAAALTLGLEASLPHYGLANFYYDWWEHFDLARFYLAPGVVHRVYLDGSTITSRTPLFNLVTSAGLWVFGDRFSVFQVATAVVGWLWILPTALLARRFLGRDRTPTVALLALSPLILFATTYGWSKGLVIFLSLAALERFLALREATPGAAPHIAVQLGLVSGLTVMAHAGYVGYLIPLFALLVRDAAVRRQRWSALALASVAAVLVALPWYAWAVSTYGWHNALFGYPQGSYTSPGAWLIDHVMIVVTSLLPISALTHSVAVQPAQQIFVAYLRTAVGLLGAGFLLRVIAKAVAQRNRQGAWSLPPSPLLAFAGSGALVATLLINGWGNGWAAAQAVFIPAFVTLALALLARRPLSRRMAGLALAECTLATSLALAYTWSSLSASEPNARLAAAMHLRFLGVDSWPVGIALLAGAAACCGVIAIRGSLARDREAPAIAA